MTNKEKVIKGLEVCANIADGESCPNDCPYYQEMCYGYGQLMRDALAILKEQGTVKPITEHHFVLCPVCKNTLFREQKFCDKCGKRIDWEGW